MRLCNIRKEADMKKELIAAVLSAALLTSCSAQKSSPSVSSGAEPASVTASTTAAADTTETTTNVTTSTAQTTTTAATTKAAVTTTVAARKTLHTDLCNTINAEDEPRAEENIKGISMRNLDIYSVSDDRAVPEATEEQKQIILDYIISHDLSPINDGVYSFFPDYGLFPDESQLSFAITVEVPCVSADHRLVFSKDRTVLGVKWDLAGEGGSYYKLEDAEQLAPIFDFAEQYTAG